MAIYSGTPACMFEMNRPEFFSGPGSGLLAGGECPALPVTELDCGFLITSAIIQSDGSYHICVQANDQTLNQTWEVWNWGAPPVIASGTLPTMCFDLASSYGAGFTIIHTVFDQTGKNTCPIFILILADTLCQEGIVTANVENCNLETTINIDITNIGTPYVITFGDGSPAEQSSANQVTHTYGQPGSHEVCLTYHVPGTEGHITCCYSIEVALPPYCTCPENVVSVVSVEPCTWVAEMNFALNIENFPITVDYGDGTSPEVVTGPSATHDFPDNGTYNVCYTFEPMPGSTLECCELVNIPGCCLDASFTLIPDYANGWESCLNPTYLVTPTACLNNIVEVTHIWEFSDGTVFNVPFPSPHIFTNFVDANGQVCVTHTIICCDESVSETVCADHIPGAYLGEFGGTIELDDILPSTGETVLQFIYDNANGPLPFIVDGQLNANMNAYFTGGTWNMAKNSVVVVVGGTGKVRDFSLNGTILRSAVWLPGNPPCCRWQGVQSRDLTNISLTDAWIMDANYAIYYPGGGAGDSNFPALSSVNSHYVNNYYGIKSEGKFVNFVAFSGNEMKGTHIDPEPQVCDCDAVNAIDFREVNPLLTIKIDAPSNGTNTIYNYEKAFNFVNTKLFVRGFDIYSLQNFGDVPSPIPNNGPGLIDAAIGIDYAWGKTLKSSLDLDRITFSEFEGQDT
ncbi:MAG: PKD domain-containing protein, partial [Saprospiraceae bacterium]